LFSIKNKKTKKTKKTKQKMKNIIKEIKNNNTKSINISDFDKEFINKNFLSNVEEGIVCCIEKGNFEEAEWLLKSSYITTSDINDIFIKNCNDGNIFSTLLIFILDEYKINIDNQQKYFFGDVMRNIDNPKSKIMLKYLEYLNFISMKNIIKNRKIEISGFFISSLSDCDEKFIQKNYDDKVLTNIKEGFYWCVKKGNFEEAEWLYVAGYVNTRKINSSFIEICAEGEILNAYWIFNLCKHKIKIDDQKGYFENVILEAKKISIFFAGLQNIEIPLGKMTIKYLDTKYIIIKKRKINNSKNVNIGNMDKEIIKKNYNKTFLSKVEEGFSCCVEKGNFEEAKWLYVAGYVTTEKINESFIENCNNCKTLNAFWIFNMDKYKIKIDDQKKYLSQNGLIEARKIEETYKIEILFDKLQNSNIFIRKMIMEYLDFESIKKIMFISKKFHVLTNEDNQNLSRIKKGFDYCCKEGYLDQAKWIYKKDNYKKIMSSCPYLKIYINHYCEYCSRYNKYMKKFSELFVYCCFNGKKEVAEWLGKKTDYYYSTFPSQYKRKFYSCYENGNKECAYLMYTIYNNKFRKRYEKKKLFFSSCADGKINIAKWLYSRDTENITRKMNKNDYGIKIFRKLMINGKIQEAEWIYYDLYKENIINGNDKGIKLFCDENNLISSK
jgi:hypothetical protein